MTTQQMPLIEPITMPYFLAYDIYEMKNGEEKEIQFETELYSIDTLVVFTIHSKLEEGGCKEEMLNTITSVEVDITITKTWDKEGSKITLTEKESKSVLKDL
ncbi:MAG: hypothetical protein KDC67_17995, partial [Ignavibacteriae bacterium]|nr:hypothetical protein [Ignavibacteriota bacterium]